MPILCRFYGICITMYFDDHNPPHFYATYGEYEITIEIESGLIKGQFPKRAMKLVLEWYEAHKEDLRENWNRAHTGEALTMIQPLD